MAPALLAAALALLVHGLGLQGSDQAAQTYRVSEARVYGVVLWDSGWYGGNLPLGYSVLVPFAGALVGLVTLGAASAAAASCAFDRLAVAAWGRRGPASWYFACSTALPVAIGQLPYLSGEAFGLFALLALRRRRTLLAAGGVLAAAACSPLAGAFTAVACAAVVLDHRGELVALLRRRGRLDGRSPGMSSTAAAALVCGAVALATIGALALAFPNNGPFPFPWTGLVLTLLVCATLATRLVPAPAVLRWGAVLFALVATAAFLVPNAVGGNAIRLAQYFGVPLLVGLLTLGDPTAPADRRRRPALPASGRSALPRRPLPRWALPGRALGARALSGRGPARNGPAGDRRRRPLLPALAWPALAQRARARGATALRRHRSLLRTAGALAVLGGFATWQWAPGLPVISSPQTAPATSATFYQPLLHQIERRSNGPVRVEAVPTTDHWESAYLAPTVSLARGWERQLDVANNPLFYRHGPLRPQAYAAWLRTNGVRWVALPHATLDYASVAEAHLLETRHVPGLRLVWSSPEWRLWRVAASPGLLSGPGRVVALDPDHVSLSIRRPSLLTLRIRYTDLWNRDSKAPGSARACVRPGRDGWTAVVARRPGTLRLDASVFAGGSDDCPGT